MDRIPEPELMLGKSQARAYAAADFEEPHSRFLALLCDRLAQLPARGAAVDLGCGPGDIALRVARAFPRWTVDAIDGSPPMLDLARQGAAASGLEARVRFHEARLPARRLPRGAYDLLLSNSLLHHLRKPGVLWSEVCRWAHPAAWVFVMDLVRPEGRAQARSLVERYAGTEPELLQQDFYNSLLAAYRLPEVRDQLEGASLDHLHLEVVSDRHFIAWGPVVRPR